MYDKDLVISILTQVDKALETIRFRTSGISSADDFAASPSGMEKLDSVCMLFLAVGESLKKVDRITSGSLFANYSQIDWKGVMGFRDVIAHHYFDIDSEQVYWLCHHNLGPLSIAIKQIIKDMK